MTTSGSSSRWTFSSCPQPLSASFSGSLCSGSIAGRFYTSQIVEAISEEMLPRFLVRDRDKVYGERFRRVTEVLGIEEIITAARSPWQNPYAERLIGSVRRECLDHLIVLDERHLIRILGDYFRYYNASR